MINMIIDEYVNAYAVRFFDGEKYLVNEVCETKKEALELVLKVISKIEA